MFASTAEYHTYKPDFAPKHTKGALSSLSSVSSSNSIVDFNTGDLLPDLWQTSSNESSVSDSLDYTSAFTKYQPQSHSPCRNHFSPFQVQVQVQGQPHSQPPSQPQPQLSPFNDARHITQTTLFSDVSPFGQNYTQLPVQRASPLWHQPLGQSTMTSQTSWNIQQPQPPIANPFHIDDNQQQIYLLDEEIPRNGSVSNDTTITVTAQSPTSSHTDSPPQPKTKAVNTQLYKTELCGPFMKTGNCPYGLKCQFAHGQAELKHIERPPKWRSKPCANWAKYGSCRYGNRCCFKHSE